MLVRRERDHSPLRVGIAERREDPAADAEIRMAVVGVLDGVFESECDAAESGRRHTV
jgi:hypothetical protein